MTVMDDEGDDDDDHPPCHDKYRRRILRAENGRKIEAKATMSMMMTDDGGDG